MFTVCQYPSELANDDQELTDPSELHINVDGGRNCVDQADQHNLEKSLKTAMQKKLIQKNHFLGIALLRLRLVLVGLDGQEHTECDVGG